MKVIAVILRRSGLELRRLTPELVAARESTHKPLPAGAVAATEGGS